MSETTLLSSLPPSTAERVETTLDRLMPHMDERFAVVGGLAIRYHVAAVGLEYPDRPLGDIDVVGHPTPSIEKDFMVAHYHVEGDSRYHALVDRRTRMKVDVFSRPSHIFMTRPEPYDSQRTLPVVTPEFQLAKTVYDVRSVLCNQLVAPKQFDDADLLLQTRVNRVAASRALGYFEGDGYRQHILAALEEARDYTRDDPRLLSAQPYQKPLICHACVETTAFPLTPLPIVYGVMLASRLRQRLIPR